MSLREHLQAIYDQHGKLTPEIGEQVARNPLHPLHSRLEWDDAAGGYQYRLVQMAELIRSVRVVYREATENEPARTEEQFADFIWQPHTYEPVEKVAADPLLRAMTLRQMEREWRAMKRRYAEFDEFWRLVRSEDEAESA